VNTLKAMDFGVNDGELKGKSAPVRDLASAVIIPPKTRRKEKPAALRDGFLARDYRSAKPASAYTG
jgi:hypothetical protein